MMPRKHVWHRKLIFEGNSLLNLGAGQNATTANYGGKYLSDRIYNSLVSMGYTLAMTSFAKESRTMTQIEAAKNTNVVPLIREGDVIFLWEITNDVFLGATATACYNRIVSYSNTVRGLGAKLIIGTMAARDHVSDTSDVWTRGQTVNQSIRNNASSICDGYVDIELYESSPGVAPFGSKPACANTVLYQGDKVHFMNAGSDVLCDNIMLPGIVTILNQ